MNDWYVRKKEVSKRRKENQTLNMTNLLKAGKPIVKDYEMINRGMHARRDFATHAYFYEFLKTAEEDVQKFIAKNISVGMNGQFQIQLFNSKTGSKMSFKMLKKAMKLPRDVRPWFSKRKREVIALLRFMAAYNKFHSTANGLKK